MSQADSLCIDFAETVGKLYFDLSGTIGRHGTEQVSRRFSLAAVFQL